MKVSRLLLAGVGSAILAGGANAAMIISTTDYGLSDYSAGPGTIITFDGALPSGYSLSGNYVLQTGSNGNGAAPATSGSSYDTTTYLSAPRGSATLTGSTLYNFVSLYWGSIDSYNTLELLDGSTVVGTITGADVSAFANGNQQSSVTNRRVTIQNDLAFNSLRFSSTQPAFEADNIQFLGSVPEPATWAMSLIGFGALGAALRRRPTRVTFA